MVADNFLQKQQKQRCGLEMPKIVNPCFHLNPKTVIQEFQRLDPDLSPPCARDGRAAAWLRQLASPRAIPGCQAV
jgi:hypothetical protein